jgi:FkbM family methyltransferase
VRLRRAPTRSGGGDAPGVRREERRGRFFIDAGKETPYVAVRLAEQLIFIRTDDGGLGRSIFVKGWRKDLAILAEALTVLGEHGVRLPDEPIFVDVGANIGTTTLMAVGRHGFTSAVAIEPSPLNYRTLKVNLMANGLEGRVRAVAAAASDREGETSFDVTAGNFGGHRVGNGDGRGTTVRTISLDGLVDQGAIDPGRVGLLWIDAVGHEGEVLVGASKLLDASVPVVVSRRRNLGLGSTADRVVELVTQNYTDVVELRDFLTRHPIDEFAGLVDSFRHSTDLLLLRRP